MNRKIYFAHPIKFYHTPDEQKVITAIKQTYPGFDIVNPADFNLPRTPFTSCADCMRTHMKPIFFKRLRYCDTFVIWRPINSCGIMCELHKAAELGKDLYEARIMKSNGRAYLNHTTIRSCHYV